MMENVPRLAGKKAFRDLRAGLSRLGYKIQWDTKDMARYGVPQRRKRLILVAGLEFKIDFAPEAKIRKKRTVRRAIGDLPAKGSGRDRLHDLPETHNEKVAQLIRAIPRDGGSRLDLPRDRQLKCHQKTDGFSDIYGRMAWDDVAPTITSGCFNPSKGRFLHPKFNRAITLREAAILQSFPRRYRFPAELGKQKLALMIGNALPPEFIRAMADVFTSEQRSQIMSRVKSSGNKSTELALMAIMRAHRIRGWRRNSNLFGKPDFVFPRIRVAVFVDGCFWHSCPQHGSRPMSNRDFWQKKLERNAARDQIVNTRLKDLGWKVVRIWQHDLKKHKSIVRRLDRHLDSKPRRGA
jgi:DNA (cytosine-5)-methyltransferase 1